MENISSILIDMGTMFVLGATELIVLIAVIVGVPYMVGKVLLRIKIITAILDMDTDPDPWIAGIVGLVLTGVIVLMGALTKATLGP